MAAVATALLNKFKVHSEAERAFKPWWNNTRDCLVYGLIMLGKIFILLIWISEVN